MKLALYSLKPVFKKGFLGLQYILRRLLILRTFQSLLLPLRFPIRPGSGEFDLKYYTALKPYCLVKGVLYKLIYPKANNKMISNVLVDGDH